MPSTERVMHALQARLLRVRAARELTPTVRRITLAGDLSGFRSDGADDHVKLLFPPPGTTEPVLPNFGDGPRYPEGVKRPAARDFTPRSFDLEAGELEIDFVLHGAGPASSWAQAAMPGAVIGQAGPRGSLVVSHDFDWYLFAADETGLPAIGRWLRELPAGRRVTVLAEVANEDARIELPTETNLDLRWLYRDGSAAGGGPLGEAVRALTLPAGVGFAWVAGEADAVRPLRAHLRDERGLPKQHTRVTGYWKRGVADHHDALEQR